MKILKAMAVTFAVVLGLTLLYLSFQAYFVRDVDAYSQTVSDGLGRSLSEPPAIAKLLFTNESLWPGWGWFVGDVVIFFGSIGAVLGLVSIGKK